MVRFFFEQPIGANNRAAIDITTQRDTSELLFFIRLSIKKFQYIEGLGLYYQLERSAKDFFPRAGLTRI